MASFEQVWSTVANRHWDPELGGLDWKKVYDEFKPRIEKAATKAEVRNHCDEMLSRLKQSHFGLIPRDDYASLQSKAKGSAHPGLDFRLLEGKLLVTAVETGSPAARAGVKRGWELVSADGMAAKHVIERLGKALHSSGMLELYASRVAQGMLMGPSGSLSEVVLSDGKTNQTMRLERQEAKGTVVRLGEMPPSRFWVENKTINNVAYVSFNGWLEAEAISDAFRKAMQTDNLKGVIVDLRGNPGGIGGIAMGAAGWFTSKPGQILGRMILRDAELKFTVFPRAQAFEGPLAILVDGASASTSEIYAGGLQDLGRARIFGSRTAGAALPSVFERLPNGDGFQFAVANYISQGGQPLEGKGVMPDEIVIPTQRELLDGKDPVLERALTWTQSAH